jgi:hypothetical protein
LGVTVGEYNKEDNNYRHQYNNWLK